MNQEDTLQDNSNVEIISHIIIRDPDTNEIILKKRDKNNEQKDDA